MLLLVIVERVSGGSHFITHITLEKNVCFRLLQRFRSASQMMIQKTLFLLFTYNRYHNACQKTKSLVQSYMYKNGHAFLTYSYWFA